MASNQTALKRQKELARKERAKAKAAERQARKLNKPAPAEGGEDPDIAGIVWGPQPPIE